MNEIIVFLQTYGIGIIFILNCVCVVILAISLQKISKTKKKLEQVTTYVQEYIDAVMKEEVISNSNIEENQTQQNDTAQLKEQQNSLISAVLQEIFP